MARKRWGNAGMAVHFTVKAQALIDPNRRLLDRMAKKDPRGMSDFMANELSRRADIDDVLRTVCGSLSARQTKQSFDSFCPFQSCSLAHADNGRGNEMSWNFSTEEFGCISFRARACGDFLSWQSICAGVHGHDEERGSSEDEHWQLKKTIRSCHWHNQSGGK